MKHIAACSCSAQRWRIAPISLQVCTSAMRSSQASRAFFMRYVARLHACAVSTHCRVMYYNTSAGQATHDGFLPMSPCAKEYVIEQLCGRACMWLSRIGYTSTSRYSGRPFSQTTHCASDLCMKASKQACCRLARCASSLHALNAAEHQRAVDLWLKRKTTALCLSFSRERAAHACSAERPQRLAHRSCLSCASAWANLQHDKAGAPYNLENE